jgi:hypothetical protein
MIDFYTMPDENALKQAMELDRAFFKLNPEKKDYCRLAIPGEDFGFFPPRTLVHVVNCGKGARLRAFYRPPEEIWRDLETESATKNARKAR